jgi:hypothetical protein
MDIRNNIILFSLLQIIAVYNATVLGWNVKKIGDNRYEFTIKKKTNDLWKIDDLSRIIDDIVVHISTQSNVADVFGSRILQGENSLLNACLYA